jgi:1-acyl-sn-glycerol-3-phosphate acyltransferase
LGLFFYYRRIQVFKAQKIPKNKPVLFLSNHQNALLDALLIAITNGRFSYFLTRASVFNKPIVTKLLKSLQMLPVYRIRDGWSNLTNNNPIFENCINLLKDNEAVAIFPEGSHNLKRTVRPFSKGFTRIVFDTLEKFPETDLQLIPVGLNFKNAIAYGDSCSVFYGKAISAKTYENVDRNQAVVQLKGDVHSEITKLTTHIETEFYDDTLKKLTDLNADFLNPKTVNSCIKNNFLKCEFKKTKTFSTVKSLLKFLLIINLFLPYAIWKLLIQPKVTEEEFMGTFRFAVAISLVPIWILAITMLLAAKFSFLLAITYLIFVFVLAFITVKS